MIAPMQVVKGLGDAKNQTRRKTPQQQINRRSEPHNGECAANGKQNTAKESRNQQAKQLQRRQHCKTDPQHGSSSGQQNKADHCAHGCNSKEQAYHQRKQRRCTTRKQECDAGDVEDGNVTFTVPRPARQFCSRQPDRPCGHRCKAKRISHGQPQIFQPGTPKHRRTGDRDDRKGQNENDPRPDSDDGCTHEPAHGPQSAAQKPPVKRLQPRARRTCGRDVVGKNCSQARVHLPSSRYKAR